MKRSVTLVSVAAKCGFHYSTVSLALRGDQRINSVTRKKILRVAEQMGYRPDPMLKALAVYRQSIKPERYHATIAWLSGGEKPEMRRSDYIFKGYVQGAVARSEQLGYKLEEFILRSPGMTPERLQDILKARCINSILVAPFPGARAYGRINLDWSAFHAVSFGYTLAAAQLHRISTHHANGARLALRKLLALGYRRIGIVIDKVTNDRVNGNWLGGYMALAVSRRIKPLVFLRRGSGSPQNLLTRTESPRLRAWILKSKIDALIIDYSPPFVEWLRASCGMDVPGDIGVASLNVLSGDSYHSGIDQQDWEIGWHALDTVVHMVNTQERGIPAVPRKLMIEGVWSAGQTVRRVNLT